MQRRRSLSREETALWAAVAKTVRPIVREEKSPPLGEVAARSADGGGLSARLRPLRPALGGPPPPKGEILRSTPPRSLENHTLDASWDKKLAKAVLSPDFTLDLHGHSLSAAHARLDQGLAQAALMEIGRAHV